MKLKIRINELARELEVKPGRILELLPELGVQEKKTHSSSIDEDVAIAIKRRFGHSENGEGFDRYRAAVAVEDDIDEHSDEEEYRPPEGREEPVARPAPRTEEPVEAPKPPEAAPAPAEDPNAVLRRAFPLRPPLATPGGGPREPIHPPISPVRTPLSPPTARTTPPPAPANFVAPTTTTPAPAAPVTPPPSLATPPPSSSTAPPNAPSTSAPGTPSAPEARQPGQAPGMPKAPAVPATPQTPRAPAQGVSQGSPSSSQPSSQPTPQQAGPGVPAARPQAPPRDAPLFRPGQVITGQRPAGDRPGAESRSLPIAPGAPRPAPGPSAPRQPIARPQTPMAPGGPRPAGPGQGAPPPSAQGPGQNRPTLAGQPAARPVVPPRPDMLARLQQTQNRPPVPGTPAPRPPMPGRPTASPGQPLVQHRGPIRPGQGPMRPAGPGVGPQGRGPAGLRPRPMHPTSPRMEPAAPMPTETQRRLQSKARTVSPEDRRRDAEGKLRPLITKKEAAAPPPIDREITIAEGITVKELSEKLGVKTALVIRKLVDRKIFATINQTLDVKLAEEIAREFGASTNALSYEEEESWEIELAEEQKDLVMRAPVVTIMGHVDHGKTSLLDAIRTTNVAAREAGGITQHIGASQVTHNGKKIVFIDTPGHEAFTRMRARGAKVTDIVVLVVAADDGVMPQTLEAIDHARAAKVPIIVAVNKIDKPGAQPERIKQQLADRGLLAEDWGGDIVMVPVSAKTQENLPLLLEMILLVSDIANLKANPTRPAVGTVLEAQLDKGRGPVATVLVQNGMLRVGDFFICGQVFGKVRAMFDHLGNGVREAEPSSAVEVLGLDALPEVGDNFQVVTDTSKAKQIVMYRETKSREQAMAKGARITLEQLHAQAKEGDVKELNLIIKTDVGGTAEVLSEMLQKLSTDKIKIRVVSKNVGAITESDILLASTSSAIVIGFNVRPDRTAAALAEKEGVDVRLHTIIYELTDEIKRAMAGLLEPVFKEVFRGRAEVREVFKISKVGSVAGCIVTEGTLTRDSQVRVLRDNIVIHTGRIESLRRFKNDVSEVKTNFECGVTLTGFSDVHTGDILEAFGMEKIAAEL